MTISNTLCDYCGSAVVAGENVKVVDLNSPLAGDVGRKSGHDTALMKQFHVSLGHSGVADKSCWTQSV